MTSKEFTYYVKDLNEEDQKALTKLTSPNKWLDFNTAFILCLGQLGLLSDSGDPVEERPQAHVIATDDPDDYKKSTVAEAKLKSWTQREPVGLWRAAATRLLSYGGLKRLRRWRSLLGRCSYRRCRP